MKRLLAALFTLLFLSPAFAANPISHVVVIVQENRSPDDLFYGLCATSPCSTIPGPGQYNIQVSNWLDKTSPTGVTQPHSVPLAVAYDVGHSHREFLLICDRSSLTSPCKMDGANTQGCRAGPCPANASYGYVQSSDVQPYLTLAQSYGFGNYFFETPQGMSYPAHLWLFGATSAPTAADDAAGNVVGDRGITPIGCTAQTGSVVYWYNQFGNIGGSTYPCFNYPILTDLLEQHNHSWKYYGVSPDDWADPQPKGIWMAPNSWQQICGLHPGGNCSGTEWTAHVPFTQNQVLTDIANCKLSNVSWVIPAGHNSDHSGGLRGNGGPSWVAAIVNAIGNSTCTSPNGLPYWGSTAIIVTWDDWGGWYDHVPPPVQPAPFGGFTWGIRVPLLVISAYTPKGTISNVPGDFAAITRFIEKRFGITEGALGFSDARTTADLHEYFRFAQLPRPFVPIAAPLSAQDFLNAPPDNTPPDDE
jgi:phospholipase C